MTRALKIAEWIATTLIVAFLCFILPALFSGA